MMCSTVLPCTVLQMEAQANMRALHGSSFAIVGPVRAANSAHYCAAPHPAERAHRAMCIVRAASVNVHSLSAVSLYCPVQTSLLQLHCTPRRSEVQLSYCSAHHWEMLYVLCCSSSHALIAGFSQVDVLTHFEACVIHVHLAFVPILNELLPAPAQGDS